MSSVSVDLSGLKELQKAIKNADKTGLDVGWFASARYDDNTPVAGVAALQEFGSKTAPPRPFMRPTIENKKGEWSDLVEQGAQAVIEGRATMDRVFDGLGLKAVADIKNSITQGDHAPLSPITLAIRRLRNEGVPIGKRTIGMVAGAIARGETGTGQLGQPYGNQDPLRDTGIMIATLTHEVKS